MFLTRTANEGVFPFAPAGNTAAHDAWFRAQVQQALDGPHPAVSHEDVEAHFSRRRAATLRKAG